MSILLILLLCTLISYIVFLKNKYNKLLIKYKNLEKLDDFTINQNHELRKNISELTKNKIPYDGIDGFSIIISDPYCSYKYYLNISNKYSIMSILNILCRGLKIEKPNGYLVSFRYNKDKSN